MPLSAGEGWVLPFKHGLHYLFYFYELQCLCFSVYFMCFGKGGGGGGSGGRGFMRYQFKLGIGHKQMFVKLD
jgi:hypothetical protein